MTIFNRIAIAVSLLILGFFVAPLGFSSWNKLKQDKHLSFHRASRPSIAELSRRVRESDTTDPLGRITIERELASEIYGLDHPYNRYDPQAIWTHKPNLDARRPFKEHPKGAWTMRTNSLGMRRDTEVQSASPDLRVLVVGDSHVDGICDNSENLCAVAEASLRRAHPGLSIEVLNCARGGHSMWNYLGVIEKYAELAPDIVIVTTFAGNDFTDLLMLGHLFEGSKSKGLTPEGKLKREEVIALSPHIMGQGYGSLYFFKERPGELSFALETTASLLQQIKRTCRESGAELMLMYLPSPLSFEREQLAHVELESRVILGLTEEDLALPRIISERFLEISASLEIPAIDLGATLDGCAETCFWQTDLHLSVEGHQKVGARLAEWIGSSASLREHL